MALQERIDEKLRTCLERYNEELEKWISFPVKNKEPVLTNFDGIVQLITGKKRYFGLHHIFPNYYPKGEGWYDHQAAIGGMENLATKYALTSAFAEEMNKEERAATMQQIISDTLVVASNNGVVGALVLSVIFGPATTSIQVSELSSSFFGQNGVEILRIIYHCILFYGIMEALFLVYAATKLYSQLSTWLPTLEAKILWLDSYPAFQVSITQTNVISCVAMSIPLNVALTMSPSLGLAATLFCVFFWYKFALNTKDQVKTMILLHEYMGRAQTHRRALRSTTKINVNGKRLSAKTVKNY